VGYTYRWEEVPDSGDPERSRFLLGRAPGGFDTSEASNFAVAVNHFAEARFKGAERVKPQTATVALKKVARTPEGYELRERGSVTGPIVVQPCRPARFVKRDLAASAAIESLAMGGKVWSGYADNAVWEELLATADQLQPSGEELRRLNIDVARLICLRAGVIVAPERLPG